MGQPVYYLRCGILVLGLLSSPTQWVSAHVLDHHIGQQHLSLSVDALDEALYLIRTLPLLETSATVQSNWGEGHIEGFVDTAQMSRVLSDIAQWGTITASQLSQRNVFAQVQDLRTELHVREQELDRLMALHAEATTVPVLMRVEQSIQQVIGHMEQLQSQLTSLETDMATTFLAVSLRVPVDDEALLEPALGFTQRLGQTFGRSAELTGVALIELLLFIVRWLIPVSLVGAMVWAVRQTYGKLKRHLGTIRRPSHGTDHTSTDDQ